MNGPVGDMHAWAKAMCLVINSAFGDRVPVPVAASSSSLRLRIECQHRAVAHALRALTRMFPEGQSDGVCKLLMDCLNPTSMVVRPCSEEARDRLLAHCGVEGWPDPQAGEFKLPVNFSQWQCCEVYKQSLIL